MAAAGEQVRTDRAGPDGRIAVITFDHPPGNALTPAVRAALMAALADAVASGAGGVVLQGAGRNFSAATSVDAADGAKGAGHPPLRALCAQVEEAPVPVVVALVGAAVGPGAELALAAHARVAATDARIVLPEVGLGLPPAGGATQRLPRLLGTADALDMLLSARAVAGPEALAMGLVDRLVDGDVLAAAVAQAAAMPGPRPLRDRTDGLSDPAAHAEAVAHARAEVARGVLPAPARIVDCVDAALYLPFENGQALEEVAQEDLSETEESQGLIAAARAERRAAALPPGVARAQPQAVSHLGLHGFAPAFGPLALVALGRGLKVTWADADKARLAAGLAWVADRQEAEVKAGRLTPVQRDADRARLHTAEGMAALAGAGLVVHAGGGDGLAPAIRQVPGAVHLVLGGAEGHLGLSLAPSARLVELAVPAGAAPVQVASAVQVLRRMALPPVLVGKMPVVGRRVTGAGRAALARLLALGVPRRVIAAALDRFGHAMPELPEPATAAPMRAMDEAGVLHRWQAAMANEGLRLLDGRVALRPSDIDHILVQGFGYPRWRGGPMHLAGARGLMVLRADMHGWLRDDPIWAPHPLMDRLIASGRRLADLDG